ncbi:hypothetical protein [Desulfobacula sp.]|uniref:hypothetical protein n=1 Tax=Desulfobacula sp. TaxID=2593537 RepID=UPI00261943CB|nr:hypothetical protein [Desulfobacula sp.]
MEFLTGALLPTVFDQDTAIVLGKTHAALHNADSSQLNEDMIAEGFGGRHYCCTNLIFFSQLPQPSHNVVSIVAK